MMEKMLTNWQVILSTGILHVLVCLQPAKSSDPEIIPIALKEFDISSSIPSVPPEVQTQLPRPVLGYKHLSDAIWYGGSSLATRLTHGADPNLSSESGDPILFYAIEASRQCEPLEELLRAGADPNRKSSRGSTALHAAIWRNNAEAVDLLLKYGADPELSDSRQSAIEYAKATCPEMVERLQRKSELLKTHRLIAPKVLRIPDLVFGSAKFRPPAGGEAIVYSADSRQIIVGDYAGTLRFFDANSGVATKAIAAHEGEIAELARIGSSNIIVSAGNRETKFWELDTSRELMRLKMGGRGLSVSPNGRWLFTGSELWEIASVEPLRLAANGRRYPQAASTLIISWSFFTPDNRYLIFGVQNGSVYIWNLENDFVRRVGDLRCEQMKKLTWGDLRTFVDIADADPEALIALATDQYTILTGASDGLRAFQPVVSASGFAGRALTMSPNGQFLAAYGDSSRIDTYDLEKNGEPIPLEGHTAALHAVAASPDGVLLASGGDDKSVRLWDRRTQAQVGLYKIQSYVYSICFSPDGKRLAIGDNDGNVSIHELGTEKVWTCPVGGRVTGVCFHSEGDMLVVLGQQLQLVDINRATVISQIPSGHSHQGALAATSDNLVVGSALSSRAGQSLYVPTGWSFDDRELVSRSDLFSEDVGHHGMIGAMAISKDGSLLASESSGFIRLWDLRKQRSVGPKMAGHTCPHLSDLQFSPDGKLLASAAWDGITQVWEIATGRCLLTLDADVHRVSSVSFFPDGSLITANWDGTAHLWDLPKHLKGD